MKITFVTDFVCPFCIVAKEALLQAMKETGIYPEIVMKPYELTVEPKEKVDTYHDPVKREHYKKLMEPVKKLGLDVKIPPNVVPRPYTRLAFEGWHYAKTKGKGGSFSDLMYLAYFQEEKDLEDMGVLKEMAKRAGLDPEGLEQALQDHSFSAIQKEADRYAKEELGVRGVPTIFVDGEKIKVEEYTKEFFANLLMKYDQEEAKPVILSVEEKMTEETETSGCGPDGCKF